MVRPGYKRTEVGDIPLDWEVRPLGALASFRTGPFGSSLHQSDYVQSGIPIVNPMHIVDGRIVPVDSMSVSEIAARRLSEFRLITGSIVMGRRGDMGRCAVVRPTNSGWLCGTGSIVIQPATGIAANYLQHILTSRRAIRDIVSSSVGTTMINLNQQTLAKLPVQLPPSTTEQMIIAQAIDESEEQVESLEHLLAKKRAIKQGAMQSLLTGAKRLPGFTDPWRQAAVGDLGRWVGGMTPSMKNDIYWKDGVVPWISSGDVKSTHLHSTGSRVTNIAIMDKATTLVPRGSVVVVTRSGILRRFLPVAITMAPMAINQDIRALLPSQDVLPAFALQTLVFHESGIRSACMKSGTTVESLEMKWLKAYRVGLPAPAEQAALAEVLADLDADLDATAAKLDKARAIKQGMMQELLTGRIRLA